MQLPTPVSPCLLPRRFAREKFAQEPIHCNLRLTLQLRWCGAHYCVRPLATSFAQNFGRNRRLAAVAVDRSAIRHDIFPRCTAAERPGSKMLYAGGPRNWIKGHCSKVHCPKDPLRCCGRLPARATIDAQSPQSGPLARRPATGNVLVAGRVRIVSAARSVISARGRGADGSSTDTYRYAAGYGSITTAIDTATINACAMNAAVMNTDATDAGAATAAISEGVS
ncbi:MAG: hypothetical protein QOD11_1260 [Bradyrhizobium sp.]|nr:hypothetical protein [Bradyrhizobium sp.]